MRHRFAAALLAASLLPAPALAQAGGATNGVDQQAQMQERLRRDEEALKRAAQDLADLARQQVEASGKQLSKAARRHLDEAMAATERALDRVRKSLDALFPDDEKVPGNAGK
jgi:hypothetical protein